MMPAALFAIQVLNQLIPLIGAGTALFAQIQQNRNTLEAMVAEKRDPTPAEWDALNAQINGLRNQLKGA